MPAPSPTGGAPGAGIVAHPDGTLLARVLERLRAGPADAMTLCHELLGLPAAPAAICDRIAVALLGADPRVRQFADGRWGLVAELQGSPLLDECAFAVVDVETTGMRPAGDDRITEIAVVVLCRGEAELAFHSLVNPGRPIPANVSAMTGITDAMVRPAPSFADIADDMVATLAGRVFVAHNVRFDWGFVSAELYRARALTLDGPRLCTVRLARRLVRGVRSCGLDNLIQELGLPNSARHRAAGDAETTTELLRRLMVLAGERGARTLQDLTALASRSSSRRRRAAAPDPITGLGREDVA